MGDLFSFRIQSRSNFINQNDGRTA
jgi:hypothetical protein